VQYAGHHPAQPLLHWLLWAMLPGTILLFILCHPRPRGAEAGHGAALKDVASTARWLGGLALVAVTIVICIAGIVFASIRADVVRSMLPGPHINVSITPGP
jgi:4-amino-4-deoxy-L-arabinose transferase-like glycosyltransferase